MGFGGILAGAMGGAAEGISQSAEQQMKTNQLVDIEKQVSDIRAEKELRIDAVRRDRDMTDIGRKARATADAAPILAEAEVKTLNLMMSDPNYVKNLSAKNLAEHAAQIRSAEISAGASKYSADKHAETSRYATDTQRELHLPDAEVKKYQLEKVQKLDTMRSELANLPPDSPERATLEQRIRDTEGTGSKSYSDVVSAAGILQRSAAQKYKEADDPTLGLSKEERDQLRKEGKALESNATEMIASVSERRGIKTGSAKTGPQVAADNPALIYQKAQKPAPAPAAAAPDPYEDSAPKGTSTKSSGIIDSAKPAEGTLSRQLYDKLAKTNNDPQAFSVLAYEANTALPKVMEQINSMQQSMESLPPGASGERSTLQKRMDDLVRARQIYEGVVAQAKARDTSAVRKPR